MMTATPAQVNRFEMRRGKALADPSTNRNIIFQQIYALLNKKKKFLTSIFKSELTSEQALKF